MKQRIGPGVDLLARLVALGGRVLSDARVDQGRIVGVDLLSAAFADNQL